jgi:YggT family protein
LNITYTGTIDLSPILAFVVLDLFSNSAAALPAEMGPDGKLIVPKKGWGNRKRGADQQ